MSSFLLKAAAVAAVLAATASAAANYISYIPTPATANFIMSPVFLWVAANAIIIWLFSSSPGRNAAAVGGDGEVPGAVGDLYSSSEYEGAFSDVDSGRPADALASKRQAREARATRRADRPRVRKKPAGEDASSARRTVVADACTERRREETPVPSADAKRLEETLPPSPLHGVQAAATESRPGDGGDDDDVSMESMWQSILQRRGARPVPVRKSETWTDKEPPRPQRVAEARREMRNPVVMEARRTDDTVRRQETPIAAGDGDVSMESMWQSILQRRAARPVAVRKSDAWTNEEPLRPQLVAETRREMRKPVAAEARRTNDTRRQELPPVTAAAIAESKPGGGGDDDVSMESMWQSIEQRRATRPVAVPKSETWSHEELPRLQRVAEATASARREMRKSVSAVNRAVAAGEAAAAAARQVGWRTRDVLVGIARDELLRRAESFIRQQREDLRLQRQESEQRQQALQLQRPLHAPALIRV